MGASNPHPHGQIWATASIPEAPSKELAAQRAYGKSRLSCLLCDYVALEEREQARVVCQNEGFIALVPFWAVWPFEILICSRRHFGSMNELAPEETGSLSRDPSSRHVHLRQSFRSSFPIFDGLPPVPYGSRGTSGMPFPRAFLSASVAVSDDSQAYGRLRNAWDAATRHHS